MWQQSEKDGIFFYTLPHWKIFGAEVILSTRIGNISKPPFDGLNMALHVDDQEEDVLSARCFFMDTLSVPRDEFVSIQQTHGKNLRRITSLDRGRGALSYQDAFADTDGIYTNESHLFMATFYADCLPLAVFDPVHRGLGLAHAGWKGTYQNIGGALIDAMKEAFDSDPKDMFFAMGAGIMSCCYEVDKSFYRRFLDQYDGASQWFSPGCTPEKYMFDNIKANSDLAIKAGIRKENMTSLNRCTCCHQEEFYSYRGSGGHCGRHGLFARLL
ncbi:MAG TPA: peptidoglycan editing factor PgeF [Firmicutes bacterium]|nr:peptidoglycan editing factor PgeF [Bacillota bacterium]